MNPEIKARWVQALRAGEYVQGQNTLRTPDDKYCCLGVLCAIAVQDGIIAPAVQCGEGASYRFGSTGATGHLPHEVQEWAGLALSNPTVSVPGPWISRTQTTLAGMNDGGATFAQIATIIEEQL